MIKRIILRLAISAILVLSLAVPAFAQGKPQGQIEKGPDNANSICSYSGLNDEPDDPILGGQTQSYGQEVKKGNIEPSASKSGPPSPGFFCNGHNFPLRQDTAPEE